MRRRIHLSGPSSNPWLPKVFLRFEECRDTSTETARIVTDAGPAYIKAMGNRQGPHALACEWVGTQLAHWFGLPTFDFALMNIDAAVDEIPLFRSGKAASGPAFVTRAVAGHKWGGSEGELDALLNPEAISHLVVFDTWTRNCDRHPPDLTVRKPNRDNVFLEDFGDREAGRCRLVAMDHGCCFNWGRDLSPRIAGLDTIRDSGLYGLFPAFVPRVRQADVESAISRLRQVDEGFVADIVASIPSAWEVNRKSRDALRKLICQRAAFVADTILGVISKNCWPGQFFDTRL